MSSCDAVAVAEVEGPVNASGGSNAPKLRVVGTCLRLGKEREERGGRVGRKNKDKIDKMHLHDCLCRILGCL